jgi:hypothetical protein
MNISNYKNFLFSLIKHSPLAALLSYYLRRLLSAFISFSINLIAYTAIDKLYVASS